VSVQASGSNCWPRSASRPDEPVAVFVTHSTWCGRGSCATAFIVMQKGRDRRERLPLAKSCQPATPLYAKIGCHRTGPSWTPAGRLSRAEETTIHSSFDTSAGGHQFGEGAPCPGRSARAISIRRLRRPRPILSDLIEDAIRHQCPAGLQKYPYRDHPLRVGQGPHNCANLRGDSAQGRCTPDGARSAVLLLRCQAAAG